MPRLISYRTEVAEANPLSGSWVLPAKWQAGDVAIFWWYAQIGTSTKAITPPGTVSTKVDFSGNGRLFIGYRTLQGGDSSFAWTATDGGANAATHWGVEVWRYVDGSGDPFEAQAAAADYASTLTPDPAAATPTSDDATVWTCIGHRNDYVTIAPPSGYLVQSAQSTTLGSDAAFASAFKRLTGGSGISQDPGTWTLTSVAAAGITWTGILKPDGAPSSNDAQLFFNRSQSTSAFSGAPFWSFGLGFFSNAGSVQSQGWSPWAAPGLIRNIKITHDVAPGAGTSVTWHLQRNGSDTGISITIADAATEGTWTGGELDVGAGDYLNWRLTFTGAPATSGNQGITCSAEFEPVEPGISVYGFPVCLTSTSTRWNGVFAPCVPSDFNWNTVSGEATNIVPIDCTIKGAFLRAHSAVGATGSYDIYIYKALAASPTTFVKQDGTGGTVNTLMQMAGDNIVTQVSFSLDLAPGDRVYLECIPVGTPNTNIRIGVAFELLADVAGEFIVAGWSGSGFTTSTLTSIYSKPSSWSVFGSGETDRDQPGPITTFTLDRLFIGTDIAPGSGSTNRVTLRKNAADTALIADMADTSVVGSDVTNDAGITSSDLFNLASIAVGATPTSGNFSTWAMRGYVSLAPPITATAAESAWEPITPTIIGDQLIVATPAISEWVLGVSSHVQNQPPIVDAGPDQILVWPTSCTQLDGTVTDDGLPESGGENIYGPQDWAAGTFNVTTPDTGDGNYPETIYREDVRTEDGTGPNGERIITSDDPAVGAHTIANFATLGGDAGFVNMWNGGLGISMEVDVQHSVDFWNETGWGYPFTIGQRNALDEYFYCFILEIDLWNEEYNVTESGDPQTSFGSATADDNWYTYRAYLLPSSDNGTTGDGIVRIWRKLSTDPEFSFTLIYENTSSFLFTTHSGDFSGMPVSGLNFVDHGRYGLLPTTNFRIFTGGGAAGLTYVWSKTSGPGDVTFSDPNILDPTVCVSIPGTYVLRLTASDGQLTAFDEMTITINSIEGGGVVGTGTNPAVGTGICGAEIPLPFVIWRLN